MPKSDIDPLEVISRAEERWASTSAEVVKLVIAGCLYKLGVHEGRLTISHTELKAMLTTHTVTGGFDIFTDSFTAKLTPLPPKEQMEVELDEAAKAKGD